MITAAILWASVILCIASGVTAIVAALSENWRSRRRWVLVVAGVLACALFGGIAAAAESTMPDEPTITIVDPDN
ncbi:hypothetical protein J1771_gp89 [Gordonia phage MelBins]|uniref:Uncharacterized protein n=1 Tax=Gordonia phage MelBins TaxID=2656540 RepID=A0A649VPR2_9CAUD|nr:hypothetical protein J1771_gp89 [Gordonia phage MelBins]QGJ93643.1 hypothetical protein SEA_MELBINS_89 [Gordonia phage MelBins]